MKKVLFAMVLLGAILLFGCYAPPMGWPHMPTMPFTEWFGGPFAFLWSLIGIAIYFIPTIIGIVRKKSNLLLIFLLNLLLGWTLIGWIVALILALL